MVMVPPTDAAVVPVHAVFQPEQGHPMLEAARLIVASEKALDALDAETIERAGPMRLAIYAQKDGVAVLRADGKVLIVGGVYNGIPFNTFDLFDPVTNLFDLSNIETIVPSSDPLITNGAFHTRPDDQAVALKNGKALITGGTHSYEINETYPCGVSLCSLDESRILDPSGGNLQSHGAMIQPRSSHTMTTLADGRVLIVGGTTRWQWNSGQFTPEPTKTAEIYDPVWGTYTATGAMKWPRTGHAAILLPTGKVLVVGGIASVTYDPTGNILNLPLETELFDPDSGTWSVMDHLDYGLSDPKMVLLKDGSVFLAGQVQAPMEPPPANANKSGLRMMAAGPVSSALKAGSTLFGTVAPSTMGWVTEVQWGSAIPVSLSQQTVPLPHWKFGVGVEDGQGSKRPAVYTAFGPNQNGLQVTLKLFKGMFTHGSGKLIGTLAPAQLGGGGAPLGQLQMEGDFTLNEGGQVVPLQIKNMPSAVNWYRGDVTWKVQTSQGTVDLQGSTRLEVFVVLTQPTTLFDKTGGVWIEVLRLLGEKGSILGVNSAQRGLQQVASYLHWSHGLTYDTMNGASSYGVTGSGSGTVNGFLLKDYLSKVSSTANCYDQAGAIQTFSAALGIQCDWLFLNPYGYINETHLLGISGLCNNPFFQMNGSQPLVAWDDHSRTAFGNHAFIRFNGLIFDACAGPHLGTEDPSQYVLSSIDARPQLYGPDFQPGTASQMQVKPGVEKIK